MFLASSQVTGRLTPIGTKYRVTLGSEREKNNNAPTLII